MDESESLSAKERETVEIIVQSKILSMALLADGQHVVSGHDNSMIRCWRMEDGKEVWTPIAVGSPVRAIAVSQDGRWIVAGTENGQVVVWCVESRRKVNKLEAHTRSINAMDVSSDGMVLMTASDDKTLKVWPLPGGKSFLFGMKDCDFHAIKFSPDGCLIALAFNRPAGAQSQSSLGIFNSQDGKLLGGLAKIDPRSFAWTSNGKRLFVLAFDGNILCVDVSTRKTLTRWPIHSNDRPTCISVSQDDSFIAASANSSVSFWDASTHQQIGAVIQHPCFINRMAISPNYDLVIAGGSKIALRDLLSIFCLGEKPKTIVEGTESHLKETIAELRVQLAITQRTAKKKEYGFEKTIESLHEDLTGQNTKYMDLEETVKDLRLQLTHFQQHADNLTKTLCVYEQKHQCEALYAEGHVVDASNSFLGITRSISDDVKADTIIMGWLTGFADKCITRLERIGDDALKIENQNEALVAYATALSLGPPGPEILLSKWASTMLLRGSIDVVLNGANEFGLSRFVVYRAICDALEGDGRVTNAIECLRRMQGELPKDTSGQIEEQPQWAFDFQRRCTERLEKLADTALDLQHYNEANEHYSTILLLAPDHVNTLCRRGKARTMLHLWDDALKDADGVIELDPASHRGYELKHSALLGARRHAEAVVVFETMLLKFQESRDGRVRELRFRYTNARRTIRDIIWTTISNMPRVLIDTTTGCLLDRSQQADTFEALPIFKELLSSMTSPMNYEWISREVEGFYRYVMFSHRWGQGEPLFQQVERVTVYKLEPSHGNIKLQSFCSLVRSLGFRWAWSDTCCIDKANNVILQESLVSMFAWYRNSSLTIIHLCDISSSSEEPYSLWNSIWNSRVWTNQEYVAAKQVQFYTRDWKPYLGLTLLNHKESPAILREMEVGQVSTEQVVLEPGLNRVREKLYLASTRETTLVEDIAYSLLGIFNASIPIVYGEGTRAVGRLLEYVLTGSGDASILAWTGTANEYNSCLPVNLTVYKTVVPPHIPRMRTAELDRVVAGLSIPDISLAIALYHDLRRLPSPVLASSRLRLPGIVSRVTNVRLSDPDKRTYRATTDLFGDVEIQTASSLATMKGLRLVHPWIRPLLEQEFARDDDGLDMETRALRLVVRLRQPFGAILFEQVSYTEFKRVAADTLIMVQMHKDVSLADLRSNVHTLEVL